MKVSITLDMKDPEAVAEAVSFLTQGNVAPATDKPKADTKPADKKADKPADTKPAEPTHTRDDVRDKLKELAQLAGKDDAVAILKKHKAASIGELAEKHFDAVHAAASTAIDEFVPPAEEPDEFD